MGLVARHRHGETANLLRVFNLDIPVAEGEELFAPNAVLAQEALDHFLLRKLRS